MTEWRAAVERVILTEGLLLDRCDWDAWLDLYAEDAVYWVPAWKSESETTASPDTEISLIFYAGRSSLADRVWRLKSGLSVASMPLRRTSHMVSNVLVEPGDDDDRAAATAAFAVHHFDPKRRRQHVFFGRYEYAFRRIGERWQIGAKTTILANDHIPTVADFYLL